MRMVTLKAALIASVVFLFSATDARSQGKTRPPRAPAKLPPSLKGRPLKASQKATVNKMLQAQKSGKKLSGRARFSSAAKIAKLLEVPSNTLATPFRLDLDHRQVPKRGAWGFNGVVQRLYPSNALSIGEGSLSHVHLMVDTTPGKVYVVECNVQVHNKLTQLFVVDVLPSGGFQPVAMSAKVIKDKGSILIGHVATKKKTMLFLRVDNPKPSSGDWWAFNGCQVTPQK